MALVNVEFVATANFTQLQQQINAANASLRALQATTKTFASSAAMLSSPKVSGGINGITQMLTQGGAFTSQMVTMSNTTQQWGQRLVENKLRLADYSKAVKQHVATGDGMVRKLAAQNLLMKQSMVIPRGISAGGQLQAQVLTSQGSLTRQAAAGYDKVRQATLLAREEAALFNKVMMQGSNQLINWGKNTQWAGRQLMVGFTMPLLVLGGLAAKTFYDFDKELTRMVKVYGNGLNALTTEQTTRMKEQAKETAFELAKAYGTPIKQTAELFGTIAQAGYEGADLVKNVELTTQLATLGSVDSQQAWQSVLTLQNAFRISTKDLQAELDYLNATENSTVLSLQDITAAIPRAAPIVRSLGGDVRDLATYLVAMREGGTPAAEAANALKSSLASLINPTKKTRDLLKGYNIDLKEIRKNSGGDLTANLLGVQKAFDALSSDQRAQAIAQTFGKFQFAKITALLDNLGRKGSQTVRAIELQSFSDAELAMLRQREIVRLQNTASGKLKRTWGEISTQLANFGQSFIGVFTEILKFVGAIGRFFQSLPDSMKKVLGGLTFGAAILGPVIMLTGVFANFVGWIAKGAMELVKFTSSGASAFKLYTAETIAAETVGEKFTSQIRLQTNNMEMLAAAVKLMGREMTLAASEASTLSAAAAPLASVGASAAGRASMALTASALNAKAAAAAVTPRATPAGIITPPVAAPMAPMAPMGGGATPFIAPWAATWRYSSDLMKTSAMSVADANRNLATTTEQASASVLSEKEKDALIKQRLRQSWNQLNAGVVAETQNFIAQNLNSGFVYEYTRTAYRQLNEAVLRQKELIDKRGRGEAVSQEKIAAADARVVAAEQNFANAIERNANTRLRMDESWKAAKLREIQAYVTIVPSVDGQGVAYKMHSAEVIAYTQMEAQARSRALLSVEDLSVANKLAALNRIEGLSEQQYLILMDKNLADAEKIAALERIAQVDTIAQQIASGSGLSLAEAETLAATIIAKNVRFEQINTDKALTAAKKIELMQSESLITAEEELILADRTLGNAEKRLQAVIQRREQLLLGGNPADTKRSGMGMGTSMAGMALTMGSMGVHGKGGEIMMKAGMGLMFASMISQMDSVKKAFKSFSAGIPKSVKGMATGLSKIGPLLMNPWVLAAVVIGAISYKIIKTMQEHARESNAWARSSEASAKSLGYEYIDLTQHIEGIGEEAQRAKAEVTQLTDAINNAQKGDALKSIAEDWKNDASAADTAAKAVAFYNLQLARGVNPKIIDTQIQALLAASENLDISATVNVEISKILVKDPKTGKITRDKEAEVTRAVEDLFSRTTVKEKGGFQKAWDEVVSHTFWNTGGDYGMTSGRNASYDTAQFEESINTFTQLSASKFDLAEEGWNKYIESLNSSQANSTIQNTAYQLQQLQAASVSAAGRVGDDRFEEAAKKIRNLGDAANYAYLSFNNIAPSADAAFWATQRSMSEAYRTATEIPEGAVDSIVAHTPGSSGDKSAGGDAYKKQSDANKDRIDAEKKIIDAIEKKRDAEKKAFDEKKKQDEYLKKLADDQIGYREALASGDFAAAARISNNMINEANRKLADDEQQRKDDAYQKDIDSHQLKIDNLNEANDKLDKLSSKAKEAQNNITDQHATNVTKVSELLQTVLRNAQTQSNTSATEMKNHNADINSELSRYGVDIDEFWKTAFSISTGALAAEAAKIPNLANDLEDKILKLGANQMDLMAIAEYARTHTAGETRDYINNVIIPGFNNRNSDNPAPTPPDPNRQMTRERARAEFLATPVGKAMLKLDGFNEEWLKWKAGPEDLWPAVPSGAPRWGGYWVDSKVPDPKGKGTLRYFDPDGSGPKLRFHTGGPIGGNPIHNSSFNKASGIQSDEVPIIAQRGEYMINASAAKKIGSEKLDIINTGELPKYHTGGQIHFHGRSGSDPSIHRYAAGPKAAPKSTTGSTGATATTPATTPARTPTPTPTPATTPSDPPVVRGSLAKLSAQYYVKSHTNSVNSYPGYNPINKKNDPGWANWPYYNNRKRKMGPWHSGNDFDAPTGTPVYSMAAGKLKLARRYGAYGNFVVISDTDGQVTRGYAHLNSIASNLSDRRSRIPRTVKHGQQIGTVGRSGFDKGSGMGAHLHYEVHPGIADPGDFGNGGGGKKWKESLKPSAFINGSKHPANRALPNNMALHMGGPVQKMQSDDVHRVLQAGEYVVQKSAVNRVGTATLDAINSGKGVATGSQSSYNITVNGAPGMDVNEIASKVVQKIELKEKRKGLARN